MRTGGVVPDASPGGPPFPTHATTKENAMQREQIEEADCSVCNKPLGQDELDDLT